MTREYSVEQLHRATEESNLVEGEPITGESFNNHLQATSACFWAAYSSQVLHPRVYHQLLFNLPLGIGAVTKSGTRFIPGTYREIPVYVGRGDGTIHAFPPPNDVSILMDGWWGEYQHAKLFLGKKAPDLRSEQVRWDFHCWFEAIHPFVDGNGRVGRLLWWNMAMLVNGVLPTIYAERRQAYYDKLEEWREEHKGSHLMNPFRERVSG